MSSVRYAAPEDGVTRWETFDKRSFQCQLVMDAFAEPYQWKFQALEEYLLLDLVSAMTPRRPWQRQQAVFLSQLEQLQVRHCSASSAATALNSLSSTNMQTNVSRVLGIQIYSCWNSFETLPPRHSYWTNLNKVVGATPRAMLPSNFLVADSSSLFG